MSRNNPPPMPPSDIRPLRKKTQPHAEHVVNPAGSKMLQRCAKASAGHRMSYAAAPDHMAKLR